MGIQNIENWEDFQAKLKEAGDKLVVVDFFAVWCGPCKMIKPKFAEFAEQYTNVIFCQVDVDEAEDVAQNCGVNSMPTFQFYKNGNKEELEVELKNAGDRLVVVDFFTTWCMPCKTIAPKIEFSCYFPPRNCPQNTLMWCSAKWMWMKLKYVEDCVLIHPI
ncbi:thioredoxin-like isoform X2 [Heptranchias perlo]|uniref:thioredoxin-like isoform X2 n=1 Tax=Heptranchias perlo TaxID=212740 RepID=UPI0035599FB9